jgi:hypothetical protein
MSTPTRVKHLRYEVQMLGETRPESKITRNSLKTKELERRGQDPNPRAVPVQRFSSSMSNLGMCSPLPRGSFTSCAGDHGVPSLKDIHSDLI